MHQLPLEQEDVELIQAAKKVIKDNYTFGRHHVGAALRTKEGKIFTAVHLEANVGRIAVCAEAIAIGKAISEGYRHFTAIAAVRHPDPEHSGAEIKPVSPCGMCRELISDYGEEMHVILPYESNLIKCSVKELLPLKYNRE